MWYSCGMRLILPFLFSLLPAAALPCGLALVLAVDVSGSVDRDEYRVQMEGLAAALRDGAVIEALVAERAEVTLVQWSGSSRQAQTLPWTAITTAEDAVRLADRVAADPRRWRNYSTALGEALLLALATFDAVPACGRRVIDVSGDGVSNEGMSPGGLRGMLSAGGVTVNALAIETDETDLTAYFFENVIAGPGAFVVTANGFEEYPEQIRRKLRRETTKQLSALKE